MILGVSQLFFFVNTRCSESNICYCKYSEVNVVNVLCIFMSVLCRVLGFMVPSYSVDFMPMFTDVHQYFCHITDSLNFLMT